MLTLTFTAYIRHSNEPIVITGRTTGECFDKADSIAAVRLIDNFSDLWIKIDGEWYGL